MRHLNVPLEDAEYGEIEAMKFSLERRAGRKLSWREALVEAARVVGAQAGGKK